MKEMVNAASEYELLMNCDLEVGIQELLDQMMIYRSGIKEIRRVSDQIFI